MPIIPMPDTLKALVEAYGKERADLSDPKRASGECGVETWAFIAVAHKRLGIDLAEVWGEDPIGCDNEPAYDQHTFMLYDHEWVIDFTARQFWLTSTYPLVEHITVYQKRFRLILDDDELDLVQNFHDRFPNFISGEGHLIM